MCREDSWTRIDMKRVLGLLSTAVLLAAIGCSRPATAPSQPEKPQPLTRPTIVGVAHIGLRTDNLAAARKFYSGVLGFQEPFTVDDPPGKLLLTYFKVNDHQYIEVFPELNDAKQDRLSHISFETTDVEQMRAYLASRGVKAGTHAGWESRLRRLRPRWSRRRIRSVHA
jgi:predicted enzyme related to lactoylglutathione lyase